MAASVSEARSVYKLLHSKLITRITPKFIQHIPTPQTYSCVVKHNSTVMLIVTLKTILNEKVGYHFCQVILLFRLRQKVVPYTKYKI